MDNRARNLDGRDRALASALVFGVLRWRSRLEWVLGNFLTKPDRPLDPAVRLILLLGLFQLDFLDKVPDSAAVNEAVNLAKKHAPNYAPKLVNAVLRAAVRAGKRPDPVESSLPQLERLALSEAHPLWLVERWANELSAEETTALLKANNQIAPLSLRVNTAQTSPEALAARLEEAGIEAVKSEYAPEGLLVYGPTGPVTSLPGYSEGLFSVQDEAAQVAGLLARPRPGEIVLDACAGLGGKTLHLAAQSEGPVFGLDPDGGRLAKALKESRRLGLPIHLVRGDLRAAPWPEESFDVVLVDAPCSNLGVIRRRPDVKWSKTPDDPARLAELQSSLLAQASKLVKPGGRLVYCVCTTTPEETLGVTDRFWMENIEFGLWPAATFLPESARPLTAPDGVLRAWPHRHGTDGFFAAVFERKVKKPPDFPMRF